VIDLHVLPPPGPTESNTVALPQRPPAVTEANLQAESAVAIFDRPAEVLSQGSRTLMKRLRNAMSSVRFYSASSCYALITANDVVQRYHGMLARQIRLERRGPASGVASPPSLTSPTGAGEGALLTLLEWLAADRDFGIFYRVRRLSKTWVSIGAGTLKKQLNKCTMDG